MARSEWYFVTRMSMRCGGDACRAIEARCCRKQSQWNTVRRAWIERSRLFLWYLLYFTKQFTGRGLVEPHLIAEIARSNGVEQSQRADSIDISCVLAKFKRYLITTHMHAHTLDRSKSECLWQPQWAQMHCENMPTPLVSWWMRVTVVGWQALEAAVGTVLIYSRLFRQEHCFEKIWYEMWNGNVSQLTCA